MKKVLVTGAGGSIGINVIKYLLSEGKYEITALDLRNKKSQKQLKKYRRRINLIYGDINDTILIDSLVKDHDFIIHLAGIMPPLADIKASLSEKIDYNGTKNIIRAIKAYNPQCHLLYASSTTIYGLNDKPTITSKPKLTILDYYSNTKLKTEKLITKEIANYTIFRLPLILTNPQNNAFMYNVKIKNIVEGITDNDAAYMFVNALNHLDKLNQNIYNATGGDSCQDTYGHILANIFKIYGISWKYILTLLFVDKNFYTHSYPDSNALDEILDYRSDSLDSYYMRLKRQIKGRHISKILAKPLIWFLGR